MHSGVEPRDCKRQTARPNSSACTFFRSDRGKGHSCRLCCSPEKAQCLHITPLNPEDKDQSPCLVDFPRKEIPHVRTNCLAAFWRISEAFASSCPLASRLQSPAPPRRVSSLSEGVTAPAKTEVQRSSRCSQQKFSHGFGLSAGFCCCSGMRSK